MLEDIKKRVEKVISLYEAQKKRADALEEQLSACRVELAAAKDRAAELNSQIDNLKLQQAFSASGDPAVAKARINKLIREIDHCIHLLEES